MGEWVSRLVSEWGWIEGWRMDESKVDGWVVIRVRLYNQINLDLNSDSCPLFDPELARYLNSLSLFPSWTRL